MVTAKRSGESYCVEVSNGHSVLLSDTQKNGKGGTVGMRPHELLESALAACVCMSMDMAAERAGVTLPEGSVDVTIERLELVIRLKSVDFPTFGRPTRTTAGAPRARFCAMQRSS